MEGFQNVMLDLQRQNKVSVLTQSLPAHCGIIGHVIGLKHHTGRKLYSVVCEHEIKTDKMCGLCCTVRLEVY